MAPWIQLYSRAPPNLPQISMIYMLLPLLAELSFALSWCLRIYRLGNPLCLWRKASRRIIKIWFMMFRMTSTAAGWRLVPVTKVSRYYCAYYSAEDRYMVDKRSITPNQHCGEFPVGFFFLGGGLVLKNTFKWPLLQTRAEFYRTRKWTCHIRAFSFPQGKKEGEGLWFY